MSEWQEVKEAFFELLKTHKQLCDSKKLARLSKQYLQELKRHKKKLDMFNEEIKKHNEKYGTKFPLVRM